MRKFGPLLGAAVVLLTNVFVLVGVARNRAGTPIETIQLTNRELPTGFHREENTGISLRFNSNMRVQQPDQPSPLSWLDEQKLKSLGFDTGSALRDTRHQPLPRRAYVAYEYNGPEWDRWLEEQQRQPYFNAGTRDISSRLFLIDAAPAAEPLLQKYTDRQKYLIIRAVVRAYAGAGGPPTRIEGVISEMLPPEIHVAPSLANLFAKTPYTVTIAYGHGFEPWVLGP